MEDIKSFWQFTLNAEKIAIIINKQKTDDSLACGLALVKILETAGKTTDILIDNNQKNKRLNFLNQNSLKIELPKNNKYSINLKLQNNELDNFNYTLNNNELKVSFSSSSEILASEPILKIEPAYDLIITIGCANWDDLGNLFTKNSNLFYETTIINIDNNYSNENFGQLNLINIIAVSLAEIIFNLIENQLTILSSEAATCLLTGLICQTKNFKLATVTPNTLETAANLIKAGADKELIINELYRKKSLNLMKLWGIILSNLNSTNNKKIIWSQISKEIWLTAGGQLDYFSALAEELLVGLPEADLIILIINNEEENLVYLYSPKNLDAFYLAENYSPKGNAKLAGFITQVASDTIINSINEKLEKITNTI